MIKKSMAILMIGLLMAQPIIVANATEVIGSKEIQRSDEKFDDINKIEFSQSFKVGEQKYIAYYYRDRCYYCNFIKDKIADYAYNVNYRGIYAINMDVDKNIYGLYSMKDHHTKYDINIGEVDQNGKDVYYPGESEEKYLNSQEPYYEIIKTDSDTYDKYKKMNLNAEINKIYAVDYTPRIDIENTDNFKVAGTPTAIYVENGKIIKYAIGTEEVIKLFDNYSENLKNS